MLFVQETTHGNMEGYFTSLPLDWLQTKVTLSLSPHLGQLKPWLEAEEKNVDEIATVVRERVSNDDPWFLGPIVIALYYWQHEQKPSFHLAIQQEQKTEEIPRYGSLELSGSEEWVIVDGLHRLLGMFKALGSMTWKKEKLSQNPIPVIFLPTSNVEQLQDLIVRMHKSARTVTRGETIRTAIADRYSLYANRLKGDDEPTYPGAIPKDLVNWKSNTITNRLPKFTTLSVLYDSAKALDEAFGKLFSPTPEQMDERYLQICGIWKMVLKRFPLFQNAVLGPPEGLPSLREKFLCMRPTGQLILVNVMAFAIKEQVSLVKVIERLTAVPWEIRNPIWQDVIIVEGRVNGRAVATLLAARLVAYLIGIPLSDNEMEVLKHGYKRGKEALPSQLFKPLERVDDQEAAKISRDEIA